MGQYYYFQHENGTINKKPLQWNFGLPWIKSLEKLDEMEQIKIFKDIMLMNNWKNGNVSAVGDYGYTIIYDSESNTIECEFEPKDR